ncbi:chloride channel protein [Candidatus Sumerlaeota bacterium]|nr:chloride channel protein [Candidatus Sumerlaeota bacterium]
MPDLTEKAMPKIRWRPRLTEDHRSVFWAVVIGMAAGFTAYLFRETIEGLGHLFYHSLPDRLGFDSPTEMGWMMIAIWIPALGGLIVGPMVYRWAIEARGHGVPEVMLSLSRESGRIRPRVGAVKAGASVITMGTGGSAGPEGPIIQIGASVGSLVGQWLRMPARKVKTFVACGAAAGISAVFNAPITGVFFAIEVLIGELKPRSFSFVAVASVTAWVVSVSLMGERPLLEVPKWHFLHAGDFLLCAVLGILAALTARLFVIVLYWVEDLFKKLPLTVYLRPALGGLMVGLIAIAFPQILSTGDREITAALHGTIQTREATLINLDFVDHPSALEVPLIQPGEETINPLINQIGASGLIRAMSLMLVLALAKILATSLCLGSGGSGGVFAPALFVGAMLGGAFGLALQLVFPGHTASVGAYAVVGMSATLAASAHAPMTAVLILFELTRDYAMIPASMVATVVAVLISYQLAPDSIYTVKFKRRGLRIGDSQRRDPLMQIQVRDAMATEIFTLKPTMTMREALLFTETVGQRAYPVVGEGGEDLLGLISLYDLNLAMAGNRPDTTPIGELMDHHPVVAMPDEYLDRAITDLEDCDAGMLPVISSREERRLVGVLTNATVIRAYNDYQRDRE